MYNYESLQVYNISKNNSLKKYLLQESIDLNNIFKNYENIKILNYNKNNNCGNILLDEKKTKYFVKFSPLVDPIKYITNNYIEQKVESNNENLNIEKYLNNDEYMMSLHNNEQYEENMKKIKNKINYPMNCAFIDCFFTYLSNLLKKELNFNHSLNVYDSFTCIKNDFKIDIGDSLGLVDNNKEMYKNVKQNFVSFNNTDFQEMYLDTNNIQLDSDDEDEFINNSKNNKPLIKINKENIDISLNEIVFDEIEEIDISNKNDINELNELSISNNNSLKLINNDDSSNDDNSDESFTDNEDDYDNNENENDNDELKLVEKKNMNIEIEMDDDNKSIESNIEDNLCSSDGSYSDESDESEDDPEVFITIKKIPTETIIMEKCENTLDYLLEEELINMEELKSALFQIIINLLCYQKAFKMTHNDLHTNNIMFIETDKQYLWYKYNKKMYKVPTFGKIYKIIDFGRSIFSFKGKSFASDSFNKNEDADTQYNCEPFFDDSKKRIENNFSFDLCRLGCSLYDFFIEEEDDVEEMKKIPVINMIISWVYDDNNKNILYKADGSIRYPGFKIYKMISRNVHNHSPEIEMNNKLFDDYIIKDNKKVKQLSNKYSNKIFNINKLDEFYEKWNL